MFIAVSLLPQNLRHGLAQRGDIVRLARIQRITNRRLFGTSAPAKRTLHRLIRPQAQIALVQPMTTRQDRDKTIQQLFTRRILAYFLLDHDLLFYHRPNPLVSKPNANRHQTRLCRNRNAFFHDDGPFHSLLVFPSQNEPNLPSWANLINSRFVAYFGQNLGKWVTTLSIDLVSPI